MNNKIKQLHKRAEKYCSLSKQQLINDCFKGTKRYVFEGQKKKKLKEIVHELRK